MENKAGVYKIESIINNKRIYIGSSITILNRKWQHLSSLRRNKHHSKKLQRHFNKYGEDDLVFSVVLYCEVEEVLQKEQEYLDLFSPYFNNCKTAGSNLGFKHTEETKRKIGLWNIGRTDGIGRKVSDETKAKLSKLNSGKLNKFYGKHHTEESKKKFRESRMGKGKMVLNLETGIYYSSIRDAAASLNLSEVTLGQRLRGFMKNTTYFVLV